MHYRILTVSKPLNERYLLCNMKELHDNLFYCQTCSSTTRPLLISSCMHMTCTTCTTQITTCPVCHSPTEFMRLTDQLKATFSCNPTKLLERPAHIISFQMESVVNRMMWLESERVRYRGLLVRARNELMRVKRMRGVSSFWGVDERGRIGNERVGEGGDERGRIGNERVGEGGDERGRIGNGRVGGENTNWNKICKKDGNRSDVNNTGGDRNGSKQYDGGTKRYDRITERRNSTRKERATRRKTLKRRPNVIHSSGAAKERVISLTRIDKNGQTNKSTEIHNNAGNPWIDTSINDQSSSNSGTDYLHTIKFTKRMMKSKEDVHKHSKEESTGNTYNEYLRRMCESGRKESSTEVTSGCTGRLTIPVKRSRRFFYRKKRKE
ncbi:hypothetical protein VCUG_01230 [Vavraia culicis subsp. floridensis]|uniref:RING-type domain-containing protein n=1 Tax=Vavraia culicis (isolate floridensis) TaxID=948595 RepID=L2GUB8_VAVCU|nr:uncharacterized protein VCUG_01230 [Vavraia culicis subsp. floridensis]ELA47234.1 hypothetical protein VCUG_01230 [Vavraia culicis subsp. floridensis]